MQPLKNASELEAERIRYYLNWGQSYKYLYTQGQIYKRVLKHENNALAQTFVGRNVRTQHPIIFSGLHFYLTFKQQFRLFILHCPKV